MRIYRPPGFEVKNQNVTDKTIRDTILEDETNEWIDVFIMFIIFMGIAAAIYYYPFTSSQLQLIHMAVLIGISALHVGIAKYVGFKWARRPFVKAYFKKAKWTKGKVLYFKKSPGDLLASYWVAFQNDDGKKHKFYLTQSEYLNLQNTYLDELVVLSYPKISICPFNKTGYRIFDANSTRNTSSIPYPWEKH